MAVRPIRTTPDPVLRVVCAPVTDFDSDLAALAQDMLDTMYAAPGRGLAAPQIGVSQRLFVMDATWKEGTPAPMIFVNPDVLARSTTLATMEEGCLSIPGDLVAVSRPDQVTLRWQGVDGAWHEETFAGFAAACTQHEIDHLDGFLITDKPA